MKEEYEQLCKEIQKHDYLYYVRFEPEISDAEYDFLIKRLQKIEQEYPEWITATSPTQRVGESLLGGFQTVKHRHPMLSLENAYSQEELRLFLDRLDKILESEQKEYIAELKMDGIAVSVIYRQGIFSQAITRGNGVEGDDITHNMRTVINLPLKLYGESIPDYLEVRGEVYLEKEQFELLNKEREVKWANPRNATGGTLKLLDPKESSQRRLRVSFYSVAETQGISIKTQEQLFGYLKKLHLPVVTDYALCKSLEEIWDFAQKIDQKRLSLPFEIDGIVIKVNDLTTQKDLGHTRKHWRWAMAYKFAAERTRTRIREITVQVGRTGVLTPVAELEPTLLAGSRISRATLHNESEVISKDIRVGDYVFIEKGGDVIPKVVEVDQGMRSCDSSAVWKMVEVCPSCGGSIVKVEDEVAHKCLNHLECPTQVLKRIIYFASKPAMSIEFLGEKIAKQLFDHQLIHNPSDLYHLQEEQLISLDGFQEKSVRNLLQSIEKSKQVTFARWLVALGIPYVGIGTAELLAKISGSYARLKEMTLEELEAIDGIGEKVAHALIHFFQDPLYQKEVDHLFAVGVIPLDVEEIADQSHPFFGKVFVLTGSLQQHTRSGVTALIKKRGGKVSSSVSKKTNFVLVGKDPGSKFEKAQKLNITILTEEEFEEIVYGS